MTTYRRPPRLASAAGFTLIEVIVVLALVVLLASMGMSQYRNSLQYGKEAVLKEDLFRMRDAIDQYQADKGKYPATIEDLVTDGYLREVPKDPITNSADTWQTVNAEPDPANPTTQMGIYDVKSGAEQQALDGTSYSDWN
jgi:general secretion pathway protein G